MTANIIDGNAVAAKLREEIAADVASMVAEGLPRPGLAAVLVGDNPASQQYVRMKRKACEKAGLESFGFTLPADISQAELERVVSQLKSDPKGDGILCQRPLPMHLDEEK